jgi:hypothetical protein
MKNYRSREPSDISESDFSDDSNTNVNMSSGREQRANSDDEDNVSDNSDVQHHTWTRLGVKRPRFAFKGKLA